MYIRLTYFNKLKFSILAYEFILFAIYVSNYMQLTLAHKNDADSTSSPHLQKTEQHSYCMLI